MEMYVCMYIHTYIHTYIHLDYQYAYIYIYIYIPWLPSYSLCPPPMLLQPAPARISCMCLCVYMYVYIYIYIYICIHIHNNCATVCLHTRSRARPVLILGSQLLTYVHARIHTCKLCCVLAWSLSKKSSVCMHTNVHVRI
jgi:hypothetical protein